MPNELIINKPYAYCRELSRDINNATYVRAYCDAPGSLAIQVRTFAPITENRRGKARVMIAGASLEVDDAKKLAAMLAQFIADNDRT